MARNKFFVFMENLETEWAKTRYGTSPRELTDDDIDDWMQSADSPRPMPPRTRDEVIRGLMRVNRIKFYQYRSHREWARKHIAKMGLDPEQERWLL